MTTHLAVQAGKAGKRVGMIDLDPQASTAEWHSVREAGDPVLLDHEKLGLSRTIAAARSDGYDLILIDTPPRLEKQVADALGVTDFALLIVRPSPVDLRAVGATLRMIQEAQRGFAFILNQTVPRARITSEAQVMLSRHGPIAGTVAARVEFAASMTDGRTIMETDPKSAGTAEMAEIWSYLNGRLENNNG